MSKTVKTTETKTTTTTVTETSFITDPPSPQKTPLKRKRNKPSKSGGRTGKWVQQSNYYEYPEEE